MVEGGGTLPRYPQTAPPQPRDRASPVPIFQRASDLTTADAGYLDTSTWTSEDHRAAEEFQRTAGLLANGRHEGVIQSYPDASRSSGQNPGRR